MKNRLALVLASLFAGCAATPLTETPATAPSNTGAYAVLGAWTQPSALDARVMIDEYGPPDEIRSDSLTWRDRGPWDRIEVWNAPVDGPTPRMQESVAYPLTEADAAKLKSFDGRVVCDVAAGRLAAHAPAEDLNFLLLNLSDDIVNGRKSVDQAKADYTRILERSYAGKSSPYMKGLLFRYGSLSR